MMERFVVVTVIESIDIGMSIKKRLNICQRALLGCFNKSIIELLLVRCHWCLSLMLLNIASIKSNQMCATIFDSHEIEYRGIPNTFNREQQDDCARKGGRRCERGRGSEQQREREILCGSLSLSHISCVRVSINL